MESAERQFWKDKLQSIRRVIPINGLYGEDELTFDEKSKKLTTFIAVPEEGKNMIHFEEVYFEWRRDVLEAMHYFAALWHYFNTVATNSECSTLKFDLVDIFRVEPVQRLIELYGIISIARDRVIRITSDKCSNIEQLCEEEIRLLMNINKHYDKQAEDCNDIGIELLKRIGYKEKEIEEIYFDKSTDEIKNWLKIHSRNLESSVKAENISILMLYRLRHRLDELLSGEKEGFRGNYHDMIRDSLKVNTFLELPSCDVIRQYLV